MDVTINSMSWHLAPDPATQECLATTHEALHSCSNPIGGREVCCVDWLSHAESVHSTRRFV